MDIAKKTISLIDERIYQFINNEVLTKTSINSDQFWQGVESIVDDLTPENARLLSVRNTLQEKIDSWHRENRSKPFDAKAYEKFLRSINYIVEEGEDFEIETTHVDDEIATVSAPQLVVPVKNARFALNAANARWGSLYDALYGSDAIPIEKETAPGKKYNPARGEKVIAYGRDFLDKNFPLDNASHHDATCYMVYYNHLIVLFEDGSQSWLKKPSQFVALAGHKSDPESILLKNNGLHVELQFGRKNDIGRNDKAHLQDILIEAAVTCIMDCEDSVAAVDVDDKIEVYSNWLGLMTGELCSTFKKNGIEIERRLNKHREFTSYDGDSYHVAGRSLMLIRNVGLLMESNMMQNSSGSFVPEGILDAIFTSLIGSLDLQREESLRNSQKGSIYIVKPKLHGPEEVQFTCTLFNRVEDLLNLPRNTIKIGIMDEERRTTLNLKECIRAAKQRVVFINTGFLDRTGDEIHTSMEAGAFLLKSEIKNQHWIQAYEENNVNVGLRCGLSGKAQIGKGMWPMPDEMQQMLKTKIGHLLQGATTAWVPSPTAAVLHALHYHEVNVADTHLQLKRNSPIPRHEIINLPIIPEGFSYLAETVEQELANNLQGILGYVVRWIELGIGCSKVPDIENTGLMEDRATLRISCQHIANWLHHRICSEAQVLQIMYAMAAVVDKQNARTPDYIALLSKESVALAAAQSLIFEGLSQPNGYTEPLLHKFRLQVINNH